MKRFTLFATLLTSMLSFSAAATPQPLSVGDPAPKVTSITEAGVSLELGSLYSKQKYTLVYFYPKADTPGCTAQGCSLRDSYEVLTQKGVAIVGVSTDTVKAQADFKAKYKLPFTLLADTEKAVLQAFGVGSTFGFSSRQAFLIEGGKIVYVDHKGSTKQQADDILKFLATQGG
jgi:peroxiredoxin Q/BCP